MPIYEDFKVGDVWVRRDGKEVTIDTVEPMSNARFPIHAGRLWFYPDGRTCINEPEHDLIHKKTNPDTHLSIAAKIAASQARVEGMKAKNYERQMNGDAFAYDETDFFAEAQLLEQLADEAVRVDYNVLTQ